MSGATHPTAPPGVSQPPRSFAAPTQQQQSQSAFSNGLTQADPPTTTNANPTSSTAVNNAANNALSSVPPPSSSHIPTQHPQTPAQQVLVSAADRWGLLGLLAMIQSANADVDHGLTSMGTDLGTMGLDMAYSGCGAVAFD
jgi:CCR4-NOT transcription complex subunit 2